MAADDKAAVVNGTVITKTGLDKEAKGLQQQYQYMGQHGAVPSPPEIRKEALGKLIQMELLYQDSVTRGIEVDAEAVKQHLNTVISRFPSEEEFNKRIAAENLTLEDLEREFMRRKAVQSLVEKEIAPSAVVSEEASKKFYDENPDKFVQPEQVKASHILIKVAPDVDDDEKTEKRREINKIRQKLDDGADFAETAKKFSEGPSGPNGGDLGFFTRDRMVPPFADAAFALEVGQVSDIVITQFGYHLIKVFEKKEGSTIPYETIKAQIDQMLQGQILGEAVNAYAKKLEEKATVERFEE